LSEVECGDVEGVVAALAGGGDAVGFAGEGGWSVAGGACHGVVAVASWGFGWGWGEGFE
jgi:hypothetical protein